ncbi:MAG TPA: hypothetical protein VE075_01525 [Thermoanaerobaculia bacterium]|nr:hypothetical protein [Thermoanaerobaculia bacterium]
MSPTGNRTRTKRTTSRKAAGRKTAGAKSASRRTAGTKTASRKTAGTKTASRKTAGRKSGAAKPRASIPARRPARKPGAATPRQAAPVRGRSAARPKAAAARGRASVLPEAAPSDKLGPAQLRPIDVLLYHGTGLISNAIRFFDGTDVSHSSLFLGETPPAVGEAIARGLIEQPLAVSVGDSAWVRVRRLKVRPADVSPVLGRARYYLAQRERYAYEQILLLAFLCLIRKPKVTPIFKRLVIAVLEKASQALLKLTAGRKQPMICSEFVYRCYEEATPGTLDPFGLSIRREATPEGIRTPGARHRADQVHPESVLATVMGRRSESGRTVVRTEGAKAESPGPLIQRYLRQVREPSPEAAPLAATVDSDLEGAVSRFAAQWQLAAGATPRTASAEGLGAAAALANLYGTAADFVTPGDLLKTETLMTLGTLSK